MIIPIARARLVFLDVIALQLSRVVFNDRFLLILLRIHILLLEGIHNLVVELQLDAIFEELASKFPLNAILLLLLELLQEAGLEFGHNVVRVSTLIKHSIILFFNLLVEMNNLCD